MHFSGLVARLSIVAAVALSIGACAPRTQTARRPTSWTETAPDGSKLICEMERPTGTHFPEPVCRKLSDIERERAATQTELSRPRPVPMNAN